MENNSLYSENFTIMKRMKQEGFNKGQWVGPLTGGRAEFNFGRKGH